MCKEMPVISVNKVVDPKRIIQKKNGGRRRRRGTERPKGSLIPPPKKNGSATKRPSLEQALPLREQFCFKKRPQDTYFFAK
jgi:hypothetical protein